MNGAAVPLADLTATTRADLLSALCAAIDEGLREALRNGDPTLAINDFNRGTILKMLQMERQLQEGACSLDEHAWSGDAPVDPASARLLAAELAAYLDKYLADKPEAHQWIIFSCVFLAFVVGEPMHPQHAAGWKEVFPQVYACPAYEEGSDSLCRWCACGPVGSPAEKD